jgi:hypothetical protein
MASERLTAKAVFFDIDVLGSRRSAAPPTRGVSLQIYPYVRAVLDELVAAGVQLGCISFDPSGTEDAVKAAFEATEIHRLFRPELLIFAFGGGLETDARALFSHAASQAGHAASPGSCLLVSEDSVARGQALAAGWQAAPHPLLAKDVLAGHGLWFVKITVPQHHDAEDWRGALRGLALVPLRASGEGGRNLLAIASRVALSALSNAQFEVQLLGQESDPAPSDLYMIRDDEAADSGFLSVAGQFEQLFGLENRANQSLLLSSSEDGILVKVPYDRTIEEFHFATARHGHNLKLVPDPGLLSSDGAWPHHVRFDALAPERDLTSEEKAIIGQLTDARIQTVLDRYAGSAPLGDASGTAVNSRHILHDGNRRVTDQLVADLQAIGGGALVVSTHAFTHNGRSYANVEAELAGNTAELVLVTAHLDSTAASSLPYNPAGDPAPGADDDGSGLAAVLAAARVICDLAAVQKPQRTIRFVLFNAEEHGLIGSQAYARDAQAAGAVIEAVYQIDMIGYNVAAPRTCEVHAGFLSSPAVQAKSAIVAERVRRLAPSVASTLGAMQLYLSSAGARDPAEGRSDHAPFQARGYAACAATEDFFAGPGPSAPAEANPNYHRTADTFVDLAYAADITRSIVAAAWVTASPTATPAPQGDTGAGIRVACGSTTPGTTDWKPSAGNASIYVDVDTSSSRFTNTPQYFTSLGGNSSHWATTGVTAICMPSPTSFRVYVRWSNGSPLTPAQANQFQWHVNWLAAGNESAGTG